MMTTTRWMPKTNGAGYWRQAKDYAAENVFKAIDECRLTDEEGWELYEALLEKTKGDLVETSEMFYDICTEYNGSTIGHLYSAITAEGKKRWNTENMEIIISVFVEHLDEEDASTAGAAVDTFDDLYDGNIKGLS